MFTVISVLIVVAAILLILVVLIQNPKGGGIDSSFGAANQLGSVQKTTDVVEKATWYLAGAILVISLASAFFIKDGTAVVVEQEESKFNPNYAVENVGVMPTFEDAPAQEGDAQ